MINFDMIGRIVNKRLSVSGVGERKGHGGVARPALRERHRSTSSPDRTFAGRQRSPAVHGQAACRGCSRSSRTSTATTTRPMTSRRRSTTSTPCTRSTLFHNIALEPPRRQHRAVRVPADRPSSPGLADAYGCRARAASRSRFARMVGEVVRPVVTGDGRTRSRTRRSRSREVLPQIGREVGPFGSDGPQSSSSARDCPIQLVAHANRDGLINEGDGRISAVQSRRSTPRLQPLRRAR